MHLVLNVGGGTSQINHWPYSEPGWEQHRLDIDPAVKPDICLDARKLCTLAPAPYDAIYCAHNLEHYYRHEAAEVVRGFAHVLKPDGFVEIRVPDLGALMREVVERNLDVDDVIYESPSGPILVHDVLFGYHVEIQRTGADFYGHKTGFTRKSLFRFMAIEGFGFHADAPTSPREIRSYFFRQVPSERVREMLGLLPPDPVVKPGV